LTGRRIAGGSVPYLLLVPVVLVLAAILGYPIYYLVKLSLQRYGLLELVQNDLFDVGADLCVPFGVTDRLRVEQGSVDRLEQWCDELNADLPMLKSFILPGGTEASARLHVARTTCRRAERDALVANEENGINPLVLAYLNRLSDFLFIAARIANAEAGRDEPLWRPGG